MFRTILVLHVFKFCMNVKFEFLALVMDIAPVYNYGMYMMK